MKIDKKIISWIILTMLLWIWVWFWYKTYENKNINNWAPIISSNTSTWEIENEETWTWNINENIKNEKEFVLIYWLPGSAIMQNLLISLYDIESWEMTYFPYSYYVDEIWSKKDTALAYLSWDEIKDFFISKWVNVKDYIELDRDIIFNLFVSTMNNPEDEYLIKFKTLDGNEKEFPIKTKEMLYKIASTDNLSNFANLENVQNSILYLLRNNEFFNEYLWEKFNWELYNWNLSSLTEKINYLDKKIISMKSVLIDKDYQMLNSIINWTIEEYKENNKKMEIEENSIEETWTWISEEIKIEKMSMSDKLKALREKNSQTNSIVNEENKDWLSSLKKKLLENRK